MRVGFVAFAALGLLVPRGAAAAGGCVPPAPVPQSVRACASADVVQGTPNRATYGFSVDDNVTGEDHAIAGGGYANLNTGARDLYSPTCLIVTVDPAFQVVCLFVTANTAKQEVKVLTLGGDSACREVDVQDRKVGPC